MRAAGTGAFGYSGRYIARRLLDAGHSVLTLTNSLKRENPFGGKAPAVPFHFDQPELLTQTLQGIQLNVRAGRRRIWIEGVLELTNCSSGHIVLI
jgi:nucleoside-diphosphate-sugar epimerase